MVSLTLILFLDCRNNLRNLCTVRSKFCHNACSTVSFIWIRTQRCTADLSRAAFLVISYGYSYNVRNFVENNYQNSDISLVCTCFRKNMPTVCSVKDCRVYYGNGETMFKFPNPCPQSWLEVVAKRDGESNIKIYNSPLHKWLFSLFFKYRQVLLWFT